VKKPSVGGASFDNGTKESWCT